MGPRHRSRPHQVKANIPRTANRRPGTHLTLPHIHPHPASSSRTASNHTTRRPQPVTHRQINTADRLAKTTSPHLLPMEDNRTRSPVPITRHTVASMVAVLRTTAMEIDIRV